MIDKIKKWGMALLGMVLLDLILGGLVSLLIMQFVA